LNAGDLVRVRIKNKRENALYTVKLLEELPTPERCPAGSREWLCEFPQKRYALVLMPHARREAGADLARHMQWSLAKRGWQVWEGKNAWRDATPDEAAQYDAYDGIPKAETRLMCDAASPAARQDGTRGFEAVVRTDVRRGGVLGDYLEGAAIKKASGDCHCVYEFNLPTTGAEWVDGNPVTNPMPAMNAPGDPMVCADDRTASPDANCEFRVVRMQMQMQKGGRTAPSSLKEYRVFVVALRDLTAGETLLCCYGRNYWVCTARHVHLQQALSDDMLDDARRICEGYPRGELLPEHALAWRLKAGQVQVRIKWVGFPEAESSWEPGAAFRARVGDGFFADAPEVLDALAVEQAAGVLRRRGLHRLAQEVHASMSKY
jgi:hypothetical protein